jgi:hypothetical protein
VTVSLTGKLPPGWPSDFPLPPGTSPAGSGSLRRADETAMVAVFSTAERPSDAFAFYTGNTQLQGSNARSVGVGSSFAGTMKFSGELEGSLSVLGREKTYIVVALSSSTSGTTV